jgi:hypothetical protein
MVSAFVLELAVGFVFVTAASYLGTTMALRGYFGRTPPTEAPTDSGDDGDDCDRDRDRTDE